MSAYPFTPPYAGYQAPYFQQPFQAQQQPETQMRTVNVVPVKSEQAAADYPVGLGATQMMMAEDDSFIAVKGVSVSGQVTMEMYVRRPPEPPKPVFDPSEYMRKDEFDARVTAILAAQKKEAAAK